MRTTAPVTQREWPALVIYRTKATITDIQHLSAPLGAAARTWRATPPPRLKTWRAGPESISPWVRARTGLGPPAVGARRSPQATRPRRALACAARLMTTYACKPSMSRLTGLRGRSSLSSSCWSTCATGPTTWSWQMRSKIFGKVSTLTTPLVYHSTTQSATL